LAASYTVLVVSMTEITPETRPTTNAVSAPDIAIDDDFGGHLAVNVLEKLVSI
jgi:hypothetical protein